MRYHLTPGRIALIKKKRSNTHAILTMPKALCGSQHKERIQQNSKGGPHGKGLCGEKGALLHCWWECKLEQSLRKTVRSILKRLKIKNMIQQFHSWAYIQKNKSIRGATYNSKDVEKLPECLSTDEGIKKMRFIHIYGKLDVWD